MFHIHFVLLRLQAIKLAVIQRLTPRPNVFHSVDMAKYAATTVSVDDFLFEKNA